ncbi:beta-glucoside-specific PTS transporter subunit IIABC [Xylocopilactobacillus apicola]|uniref:PTS beta-glucoside transporter subunit EIIBCA n=1 Tax=Xylocopilactobacillus apicola TaxID=2932184 RepID=A0AAU9CVH9_9LACO|nr:beta-glucoside-specific PTS transporter subunit IIABC [Xylocopilactobacillus apicola]BDR57989.1 PTS beta-glucoside transporter subunit EIIBCA [Xylocopilactobacillus apicola]
MSSNKEVTDQIMKYVGGVENVTNLYHCATRLRFNLVDKSKFDIKALENIPEVLSAVDSGDEAQIVIGGNVGAYYQEIMKNYQIQEHGDNNNDSKETNIFKRMLNAIVSIMSPIIVALIAGGMFKVLLAILVLFGLNKESVNYQILNFMADAAFYFLPFMLASSAAKRFRTNQYLAMMIAGVMLHPSFTAMVTAKNPIALFGMPIRLVSYGSSVIPIILVVWFMSYVDRFAEKYIPNVVKTMLKPLLIVLITAPVALIIIGPIGSLLGDGLFEIVNFLNKYAPWLIPLLMGAFNPLLVMVGMHISLLPIATTQFAKYGYENISGPGSLASNLAQAGAALAISFKEKNLKAREVAISATITAFSGITEPALYGITLKYKRVLGCVMAAGGIAGLYAGITKVVRYAFGAPGVFTLPIFIGKNPNNFLNACITAVIAVVLSFVFTYFFAVIEEPEHNQELKPVVEGTIIPLSEVNDQVFASESLGSGIAIEPSSSIITAPVAAKITMIYPTGHAIGLTDDKGQEFLIHVGIDTTKLKGKGFKTLVKENQRVEVGEPLIEVDFDLIREEGYDPTVILIAINTKHDQIVLNDQNKVSLITE